MPSAPEWLQDKFPGMDQEALEVLKENYVARGGIIYPKTVGYHATDREIEAINYMFYEWDYGYEPDYEKFLERREKQYEGPPLEHEERKLNGA